MKLLVKLGPLALVATALQLHGPPQTSAALVPNPSLEETVNDGPAGWKFTGPTNAASAAWSSEHPFTGSHCLRIDAQHGSQQWESDPIPLRPGQKYLLRWHAQFHGEKNWRFRAEFSGAEVVFKDQHGQTLTTNSQHSSCWQTQGWRPAWLLFTNPPPAATAQLRFAIHSSKPLPGGFDVDSIELDEWPPAPTGRTNESFLAVKIEDESGRPMGARIRIANSKDEPLIPPGAIAYEQANGAFHPLEEGSCYLFVPRGSYTITITRGLEFKPWERRIEATDTRHDIAVRLRRLWDWRQRGWFNGDHHTHLFRHGGSLFPSLQWRDALRVAKSEGLDFLPFMGADRYPTVPHAAGSGQSSTDFAYELTEEITEDFWGHVCPIGVPLESRHDRRYQEGPMHLDRYEAFAKQGGVLCFGHPHGPLGAGDNLEPVARLAFGHVAREFPIDLALGMPCAIDLLAMEGPRNQLERKLHDLYRLWNLGFRPAVAGATDFHIDQARQPIGAVRTYVRPETLDMNAIGQAYRAGHTFATSGPLLDLRVADAIPGDVVRQPSAGQRISVELETVSIGGLDRVEILVNGNVFHTFTATDPHRITGHCELIPDRSMWVAARAYGRDDPHLASRLEGRPLGAPQFAHTSPVYILVGGRPILAAEPADAEYFVHWCDAVLTAWEGHEPLIAERLARARRVFASLAGRARPK